MEYEKVLNEVSTQLASCKSFTQLSLMLPDLQQGSHVLIHYLEPR